MLEKQCFSMKSTLAGGHYKQAAANYRLPLYKKEATSLE